MKKLILSTIALTMSATLLFAQDEVKVGTYNLKKVVDNKTTSVKNQASSGTCWAYGGLATIESDVIKLKGDKFVNLDLSELYVARHAYYDKFIKYVRLHGNLSFTEGGFFEDVTDVIETYGIVPQDVYQGLNYGFDKNAFGEFWEALQGYADAIIKNKNERLSTAWKTGFNAILDAYLGVCPEKFMYEGKEYTPKSFAEYLGYKKSDYIAFCSFTHIPYGTMHSIEVPDNTKNGAAMNVPLADLSEIQDEALMNGFTSIWGSDVSENGFGHGTGLTILPATQKEDVPGNEMAKWEKMKSDKKSTELPVEIDVTAEKRQLWYDNYKTQDDHGMQICGLYRDQNNNTFYKVKNSWADDSNKFGGYFYASKNYFNGKTIFIVVNKKSLSEQTKKKYNIQ